MFWGWLKITQVFGKCYDCKAFIKFLKGTEVSVIPNGPSQKITFHAVSATKKKLSQNMMQHFSEFSDRKHQESLCEWTVTDYCALG